MARCLVLLAQCYTLVRPPFGRPGAPPPDLATAEPLLRRALAIQEQAATPDPGLLQSTVHQLERLYQQQGRDGEAEALLQRAAAIGERRAGPAHPFAREPRTRLAQLYEKQGRLVEAEAILLQAFEVGGRNGLLLVQEAIVSGGLRIGMSSSLRIPGDGQGDYPARGGLPGPSFDGERHGGARAGSAAGSANFVGDGRAMESPFRAFAPSGSAYQRWAWDVSKPIGYTRYPFSRSQAVGRFLAGSAQRLRALPTFAVPCRKESLEKLNSGRAGGRRVPARGVGGALSRAIR